MNRDDQLGAIVARYFQAKERGETLDPDSLVAEHPELAAELRIVLRCPIASRASGRFRQGCVRSELAYSR